MASINSKYKVLALDLDGTLTTSDKKITQATKVSIHKAIDQGVKIVLASGRPVLGISNVVKELELDKLGGYILAYNGGHIIDCKTNETLYISTVNRKFYKRICELAREYDVDALTYNDTGVIAENIKAKYVIKEGFNNSIPLHQVDKLDDSVTWDVVKFMVVGEPDKLAKALVIYKKEFGAELGVFLSEPYFMEIVPLGIEKAKSLGKLISFLGYDRSELVAIGDGLNDLPMLKYAGLSIAMENAYPEVKQTATIVTSSNDDDGVAKAIEEYILI